MLHVIILIIIIIILIIIIIIIVPAVSSLLTTSTLPAHAAKCSAVCPSRGSSMSRELPLRMMACTTLKNLIVAEDSHIIVISAN